MTDNLVCPLNERLVRAVGKLAENLKAAPFLFAPCEPVDLKRHSRLLSDAAEVQACIAEFEPRQGWITGTGSVEIIENGRVPDCDGHPLSGEMVREKRSLHFRRVCNGWQVSTFAEAEGSVLLREECAFAAELGYEDQFASLLYYRYWGCEGDKGLECVASRFAGFDGRTGGE